MARKQKTSTFEDLIEIFALLPWWAGVVFAVLSYFILHALATPDATATYDPKRPTEFVARAIWRTLAFYGQFILPIAGLIGAAASAWRRRYRMKFVERVTTSDAPDKLDRMTWPEFEMLVSESFRLDGFAVEEQGGARPDGGVDLVLRREGEKFFVQCKQWRAMKVGVEIVRELYGVMAARGATGGFVVTSGTFTQGAKEFADGRNVVLIDGPILLDMIERAERAPMASAPGARPSSSSGNVLIACPTCDSPMVLRVAKRAENAGKEFWGCSRYPACKGTREVV